jgi:hypothetical protein
MTANRAHHRHGLDIQHTGWCAQRWATYYSSGDRLHGDVTLDSTAALLRPWGHDQGYWGW